MSVFLNELKKTNSLSTTTNGAIAYNTTGNGVYDLFAQGGAYRQRSAGDKLALFQNAFFENTNLAMRCLFYLRDIRGQGQGEREFFRICFNWVALNAPNLAIRYLPYIPFFGRFDDLFCVLNTPIEREMFELIRAQLIEDLHAEHPSLLAKWLPSENASSKKTRALAIRTRTAIGVTPKTYRKMLTQLRKKIGIVETKMSQQDWASINYEAVPSRAGFIYSNSFKKHDHERYLTFINDKKTTVHAGTLYPYDVVHKAIFCSPSDLDEHAVIEKYWNNLTNYFENQSLDAFCMVDTSGSMCGQPIEVAISLGLYCAEKSTGPFANHFMTFSRTPELIEVKGTNLVDKVKRIYVRNQCENTNLEAGFQLILDTAKRAHLSQDNLPKALIIVTDGQIDSMTSENFWETNRSWRSDMEKIRDKFAAAGYKMPRLIYWNVNAFNDTNIIDDPNAPDVTFVSGFSPTIFSAVMSGKNGIDLMLEILNGERYSILPVA